ncbi:MAG: 50S ribosomal protein L16 [Sandaracinaceae bacterium]|nr:50S ribosomal protein L16 [Sandaracinaceae bacterium]
MLQPKKTKFRKVHTGRLKGVATRGNTVAFGDFGLQALESGYLTARQIEAARMAIQRYVKRAGKLYIRVFPDMPFTKKPLETRMGAGKGNVEGWRAKVLAGRILYEMEGVSEEVAREAFRRAGHKLPVLTRFVTRKEQQ